MYAILGRSASDCIKKAAGRTASNHLPFALAHFSHSCRGCQASIWFQRSVTECSPTIKNTQGCDFLTHFEFFENLQDVSTAENSSYSYENHGNRVLRCENNHYGIIWHVELYKNIKKKTKDVIFWLMSIQDVSTVENSFYSYENHGNQVLRCENTHYGIIWHVELDKNIKNT